MNVCKRYERKLCSIGHHLQQPSDGRHWGVGRVVIYANKTQTSRADHQFLPHPNSQLANQEPCLLWEFITIAGLILEETKKN